MTSFIVCIANRRALLVHVLGNIDYHITVC